MLGQESKQINNMKQEAKWHIAWFDGVSICDYQSIDFPNISSFGVINFKDIKTDKRVFLSGQWCLTEL